MKRVHRGGAEYEFQKIGFLRKIWFLLNCCGQTWLNCRKYLKVKWCVIIRDCRG